MGVPMNLWYGTVFPALESLCTRHAHEALRCMYTFNSYFSQFPHTHASAAQHVLLLGRVEYAAVKNLWRQLSSTEKKNIELRSPYTLEIDGFICFSSNAYVYTYKEERPN